jgi:formylglycine-generating enzyme required for sulfatase activity
VGAATGEADPATVSDFRLDKYLVTVGRFRQFLYAARPPDGGAGWRPAAGAGIHAYLNGGRGLAGESTTPDAAAVYETGWSSADDDMVDASDSNLTTCEWKVAPTAPFPYATWTPTPGPNEDLPVDCVNWYEAYAFCIWDGGFLPSEAEWEYAAAGGSDQRAYPWGSVAPGTANAYAIYGCNYPNGTGQCGCMNPLDDAGCSGVTNIAPVGTATAGAGLWGQLDLAGDMWEWNLDWPAPYASPCSDCANLTQGGLNEHALRGGGFGFPYASSGVAAPGADPPLPSSRETFPAGYADFVRGYGFRCARPPASAH